MTLSEQFINFKKYGYILDSKHYEEIEVQLSNGTTYTRKQLVGSNEDKNYSEYKGKGQKAVDFLLAKKSGTVNGAFYRKDIGDIDIVYGEVHDPIKHTGYGLAHIIDKHGLQDVKRLGEAIEKGIVKNGTDGKLLIEFRDYRVVLSSEWHGEKRKLVITGFTKTKKGNNPTVDAVKDYMVAVSPKPTNNITHDTAEVKSLAGMFLQLKRL